MQHDLNIAQKIIHDKNRRLKEQEKLIMALGEEVKDKEALQAQLNEQEIKAQLQRQNILDFSISQKSVSVSDNSRVTGIMRHLTTNGQENDLTIREDTTPTILNMSRKLSVDDKQSNNYIKIHQPS